MINTEALELAIKLINKQSVSPFDAGCQELMSDYLSSLGFAVEQINYNDTSNLWAKLDAGGSNMCFVGHTDVVPAGEISLWNTDPFKAVIKNNYLFGRGAVDMKGSLAAFLVALKNFMQCDYKLNNSISLLITSDEEGSCVDGTKRALAELTRRGEKIDWALVGEPSSSVRLGDVVKNGRRGSATCTIQIFGKQGHVAYPNFLVNPIHISSSLIDEIVNFNWNDADNYFQATSVQFVNFQSKYIANNVTPDSSVFAFNVRYSNNIDFSFIKQQIAFIVKKYTDNYKIDWLLSAEPFLTKQGLLLDSTTKAVSEITGVAPKLSASGGTSDGRFFAPTGSEVVELGLINKTIHQPNECFNINDLCLLTQCYQKIMENLICS